MRLYMDVERTARLNLEDTDLVHKAVEVLEGNWLGHATRPSPRLYPHQWSWDAAFVAIGYAHYDQMKAEQELRSLFRGQWSNGLLPHIVFADGAEDYFPGPDFWQTTRSPYAPRSPLTSGIVQPPLHATAAWHIYRYASDKEQARRFLAEIMPWLAAWHDYLSRERCRNEDGLIEIWHPWESGMDNSPLWDEALARVSPTELPYVRRDVAAADPGERPTDADYDRYVHLIAVLRDNDYHPSRSRRVIPFAISDVLYNSLFVQANRDLAEIARLLGADASEFEGWADHTAEGIQTKLWDDDHACYIDWNLIDDQPIATRTGAAFSPLFAGIPTTDRAEAMVAQLTDHVGVKLDETTWMVPSYGSDEPGFLATNYWRGPIWINVNWVLERGLRRYGFTYRAESLRRAMVELPRRFGFFEHYDPTTGRGHGAEQFAWTAALVLDLLFAEP